MAVDIAFNKSTVAGAPVSVSTLVSTGDPLPVTGTISSITANQAPTPGFLPLNATAITATSASQANANAVATLAGATGKTTYITGFQATASGSTAGLAVTLTIAGVVTATMNYTFTFPTGAIVGATLVVQFVQPIPASATNTSIVVTLPAGGVGNTNATVSAQGYQV